MARPRSTLQQRPRHSEGVGCSTYIHSWIILAAARSRWLSSALRSLVRHDRLPRVQTRTQRAGPWSRESGATARNRGGKPCPCGSVPKTGMWSLNPSPGSMHFNGTSTGVWPPLVYRACQARLRATPGLDTRLLWAYTHASHFETPGSPDKGLYYSGVYLSGAVFQMLLMAPVCCTLAPLCCYRRGNSLVLGSGLLSISVGCTARPGGIDHYPIFDNENDPVLAAALVEGLKKPLCARVAIRGHGDLISVIASRMLLVLDTARIGGVSASGRAY